MSKYCTHCGTVFAELTWPRLCGSCGEFTYRNPLPVAIAIVPVAGRRLLVVRRDIEPQRGHLCLPGGYMEFGEDWRESMVRELREETGVVYEAAQVTLHTVTSSPEHLTVFGLLPELAEAPSGRTEECSEITTIDRPVELAFPNHTRIAAEFVG